MIHILTVRTGDGGSEGWVLFEVKVGNRVEQFRLEFADPAGFFSKNYLRQWSSDGNRLNVEVKRYEEKGHPFYGKLLLVNLVIVFNLTSLCDTGQVVVRTNPQAVAQRNPTPCPPLYVIEPSLPKESNTFHANFEIGFDYPGPGEKHPIHESIAIAAFIQSSITFPKATTYNNLNLKQWEYFRGMIWNDDPSCLLFNRSENDSRSFNVGARWWKQFQFGAPKCMTQRSHFGDLQFLHAMGSEDNEKPHDTREGLLNWMGIMYKLACGNQGVSELQPLRAHFPAKMFDDSTDPSGGTTLRDLILASTPEYRDSKIPLRALGICMHMIQDSYAMGHVQRRLLNPKDFAGRDANGYLNFNAGTWAQWGAIVSFHTYGNQKEKRHSFYDGLEGANLPNPKDLGSYNRLHGARDAIDACVLLINAFAQKRSWDDLRQELEKGVFAIDPNAKNCNSAVDDFIPGLDKESANALVAHQVQEFDYEVGLLRKLSGLESGLYGSPMAGKQRRMLLFRNSFPTWAVCLLVVVVLLITLAAPSFFFYGR
jgi:hypothetical protein